MTKELILIGGGGHAKACIDIIELCKEYRIKGIIDLPGKFGSHVLGYPVIGNDDDIKRYSGDCWFLITIGQIKSAAPRESAFEKLLSLQCKLATIISPLAYVSKHAVIEEGTVIMHGSKVNAGAHIGKNCIINTSSDVEHDTIVGANSHISTHAVLNGGCRIGERVFVGSGAIIAQGVHICNDVIIGAGTVVYKNITEKGTYANTPFIKIS